MSGRLIIFDSAFGNTAKIADAIGEVLEDTRVINVSEVSDDDLDDLEFLFVGSPTRVFRPTPAIMNFIKGLGPKALSGVKAAVFDTRIPIEQTDSGFLKMLIKILGYADVKIAKALMKAGADLPIENGGFGVSGTEGPLIDGELERAQDWARQILA